MVNFIDAQIHWLDLTARLKTNTRRTVRQYIFFVSYCYGSKIKKWESDEAVTDVGEMKSAGIIFVGLDRKREFQMSRRR